MANYLPVLLVSVAANSIPDDSSLSTLPRGQVDYLSHNWEEEDVWRSWRNMTRQKNEIANGVRLENASWRTWWKQRNGLGTVTPETLNWLKDSDVTWLYGPLHTAVDWTPPPRPIPEPSPALDTHKPILKHRSISELLTSDHPLDDQQHVPISPSTAPRPALSHTKSDTHIARWGPSRAFRKDSPPRIDPPPVAVPVEPYTRSTSPPNTAKKRHISFNTFVEQCIAIEKPKTTVDDDEQDEQDYVPQGRYPYGGRTAWGYDDGYEEDEEEDSADEEEEQVSIWDGIANSDSDSYDDPQVFLDDDDDDDDDTAPYAPLTIYPKKPSPRSQSKVSTASSSSSTSTSTSVSTASTSSDNSQTTQKRRLSTSTVGTYRPLPRHADMRARHRLAPPLAPSRMRPRRLSPQPHVTIAPIAPTTLKTGGVSAGGWVEGFGDEGGSDDGLWGIPGPVVGRWWPSSDNQVIGNRGKNPAEQGEESAEEGGRTPVELVYVPPLGSQYRRSSAGYLKRSDAEDAEVSHQEDVYDTSRRGRRGKLFSLGVGGDEDAADGDGKEDPREDSGVSGEDNKGTFISGTPVPTVIVRNDTYTAEVGDGSGEEKARAWKGREARGRSTKGSLSFLGVGPGKDDGDRTGSRGSQEREPSTTRGRSRSTSRSTSRTPSPAMISPSTSLSSADPPSASPPSPPATTIHHALNGTQSLPGTGAPLDPVSSPCTSPSALSPAPVTSGLLAPPARGRGRSSARVDGERSDGDGSGRDALRGGERRGRDRVGKRLSSSPDTTLAAGARSGAAHTASESSSTSSSSTTITRAPEPAHGSEAASPIDIPAVLYETGTIYGADEEQQRWLQPTPSNSPVVALRAGPPYIAAPAPKHPHQAIPVPRPSTPPKQLHVAPHTVRARLSVPAAYPPGPSTSQRLSTSPPRGLSPAPEAVPLGDRVGAGAGEAGAAALAAAAASSGPRSPVGKGGGDGGVGPEGTIVGKAVGIVSSAGAFLGLWTGS